MIKDAHHRDMYAGLQRVGGVDEATIRREKERRENGCVIRSLESALGAKATPGEWGFRLRHLKQNPTINIYENYRAAYKRNVTAEAKNIGRLLRHIAVSATPLGRAARGYTYEQTTLTGLEIKERLKTPAQILVTFRYPGSAHVAHLEYGRDEVVRRKSDGGWPADLDPNQDYHTIVFYPKPMTRERFEGLMGGGFNRRVSS